LARRGDGGIGCIPAVALKIAALGLPPALVEFHHRLADRENIEGLGHQDPGG
jgi:hypothetical protein